MCMVALELFQQLLISGIDSHYAGRNKIEVSLAAIQYIIRNIRNIN